jgi:hypothetical protein
MYTISALWTHAREHLNITTIILKNNSYGILREEWEHLREPGQNELHDSPLINLAEHRSTSPGWPNPRAAPRHTPTPPKNSPST